MITALFTCGKCKTKRAKFFLPDMPKDDDQLLSWLDLLTDQLGAFHSLRSVGKCGAERVDLVEVLDVPDDFAARVKATEWEGCKLVW